MRDKLPDGTRFPEALFDVAPDAILIIGADGRILRANYQAEQLFGYTSTELIEKPIEVLIPARYADHHVALRAAYTLAPHARRMGAGMELYAKRRDGRELAVEVALGPLQVGAERQVLCIIRDITERKLAEQALRHAHDELELRVQERTSELSHANRMLKGYAARLERSNRELQDFAFVASHDLQEPLRKIVAFGDRLKSRSGALDAQGRDYLERMQNAARRMQTLIYDLLEYSRITTKAQPFKPVDLAQIAIEVLSDLEIQIENAGANIALGELPTIEADATQIRQLLQNLIGNAIKFRHPERAPHIEVFVRNPATPLEQTAFVELVVKDNGIGFEPGYSDRIFGLFQRLHGREEYAGSGVGLAICRKIAERHSGKIVAIGLPGQGASFVVTLPRTQSLAEPSL